MSRGEKKGRGGNRTPMEVETMATAEQVVPKSKVTVSVTFTQEQMSILDEFVSRIRQWAYMAQMGQVENENAVRAILTETNNLTTALWGGVLDVVEE